MEETALRGNKAGKRNNSGCVYFPHLLPPLLFMLLLLCRNNHLRNEPSFPFTHTREFHTLLWKHLSLNSAVEISTRVQVALVESVVCTQRCLSALSFAVAALVINWSIRSLLLRKQCPSDVPHCHFAFVQSVHGVEPSEVTSTSPPFFPLLRIASSLISQENEPWSAREELRSGRDLKKSTGVCSAATED